MANELTVLDSNEIIETGVSTINENELPAVIQGQVTMLNDLDKSVRKALAAAKTAWRSARIARGKSAGLFHKKAAIEGLQSAGVDLAKAVVSGAEAQEISFEFQTKLAEITKYLFGLGVSNIASNRSVVRELELKLKGASEEELTELARQEITNVVRQLKAQEDILVKLASLFKIAEDHDNELKAQSLKLDQHGEELHLKAKKDEEHNSYLESLQKTYQEMKKHIEEQSLAIEVKKLKLGRLNDKVENIHPLLTNKAGRFFPLVSFILSVVALVGAVAFILIK